MTAVFLSDLPDDLLCHILSFMPIKEAASTSVLARRWRMLWLLSGALNLDSRTLQCRYRRRPISQVAMDAYDDSSCSLKKLTFYFDQIVEDEGDDDDDESDHNSCDDFDTHQEEIEWAMRSQLNDLLSSPAARHLEELYFAISYKGWMCNFRITTLPILKALRVLHITNCIDNQSLENMTVAFPRLTELWLNQCRVKREIVQAIIDTSPLLNTLLLDGGSFAWCREPQQFLSLPKVTTLLLESFYCDLTNLELDAPNLKSFIYKGPIRSLTLKAPMPHITRVELHFDVSAIYRRDVVCQFFWQFVSKFSSAKMLVLRFQPWPILYHHTRGPDDV